MRGHADKGVCLDGPWLVGLLAGQARDRIGFDPRMDRMGFVELVLTVCAAIQPAACEERKLTFLDSGSLMQCMVQAPPKIAEWSGSHPNRRVVKWRCRYPSTEGTKA